MNFMICKLSLNKIILKKETLVTWPGISACGKASNNPVRTGYSEVFTGISK